MTQVKLSVSDLPQVTRALNFIQVQLAELVERCDNMRQKGLVSDSSILELENQLKKILHETCAVCGPPPIKPVKDDFDIGKYIARGSFGRVNIVRHKKSQQIFATKQILVLSEKHRDLILMERDILVFLDSPLVVSLFCAFEKGYHMYMVLEYVGGGSLEDVMSKCQRLSVGRSRFYIAEVVLAVEYIHSNGIIHRDLKPDNLLITTTGHIKVADFGASKCGSVNITCRTKKDCQRVAREFTDNEECGTPQFLAPEVLKHTGYGKSMDWWSTGAILFYFLYGNPPWEYPPEYDDEYDSFADDSDSDDSIMVEDDVKNYNCVINDIPWPDIYFPMPPDVLNLISRLLDKNSVTRLGTRGAYEVKRHPFFKDVDWSNLLNQKAPFIPVAETDEEFQIAAHPPELSDIDDDDDYLYEPSAEPADFCYVAFRFKEQHSSPLPMSTCRPMNRDLLSEQPEHSEAVEEQEPNSTDEDDSVEKGVKYYTADEFNKDDSVEEGVKYYTADEFNKDDSGVDSVKDSDEDDSAKNGVKHQTMDKDDDSGVDSVKDSDEDDSAKNGVKHQTMDKEDDSGVDSVKDSDEDDSAKNGFKHQTMDKEDDSGVDSVQDSDEDDSAKNGVKHQTMDKEDDSGVDSVQDSDEDDSAKNGVKHQTMDKEDDSGVDSVKDSDEDDSAKNGVKHQTMDKEDDSGVDSVQDSDEDDSAKNGVKHQTMDKEDDSGVDSVQDSDEDDSVKNGVKHQTMDKEDDSGVDSFQDSDEDDSAKNGVKHQTMDKEDDSGEDSVKYSVEDNLVEDNDHRNVDDKTLSEVNPLLIPNPETNTMSHLKSAIKPMMWVTLGVGAALLVYRICKGR